MSSTAALPPAGRTMPSCGSCAAVSRAAAVGASRAARDAAGQAADVRRGVAGALRRGGAAPHRGGVRGNSGEARDESARRRAARSRATSSSKRRSSSRAIGSMAVFQAAIRACRDRTRPVRRAAGGESFTVEYVTGKSWSGYNWYQGNYRSLIQVNTDLPIYIDRALDLACHEGYPGHHVYNVAAREAPGSRSRLDRVHRLPAVLAAVADRRRHGQLRHRGRVSAGRADCLRARRAVPAGQHRRDTGAGILRGHGAGRSARRMPATKPRGAISTVRSTPRPRPTGSSATR